MPETIFITSSNPAIHMHASTSIPRKVGPHIYSHPAAIHSTDLHVTVAFFVATTAIYPTTHPRGAIV